jgi:hypothetical protein
VIAWKYQLRGTWAAAQSITSFKNRKPQIRAAHRTVSTIYFNHKTSFKRSDELR